MLLHLKWNINARDTATTLQRQLSCRSSSRQPCLMLRRPIKRRLISLSLSSESLAPSSDFLVNPTKTIWFAVTFPLHSRHFVCHLEICNRICVKHLRLMFAVITHNSAKKRRLCINKWLSYSQLQWFTAAILSANLEFVMGFLSNFYNSCALSLRTFSEKIKSLY